MLIPLSPPIVCGVLATDYSSDINLTGVAFNSRKVNYQFGLAWLLLLNIKLAILKVLMYT